MTDDQLREAAARALGWLVVPASDGRVWLRGRPGIVDTADEPPPLDWTTAGALLERTCCLPYFCISMGNCGTGSRIEACGDSWPSVTARNVIEACVSALGHGRTSVMALGGGEG